MHQMHKEISQEIKVIGANRNMRNITDKNYLLGRGMIMVKENCRAILQKTRQKIVTRKLDINLVVM